MVPWLVLGSHDRSIGPARCAVELHEAPPSVEVDDPTLSWKENNTGMEFWHFQKTDGLNWYAAVAELHSRQTLAAAFDWNALVRQKTDPYLLVLKGIPAPPSAWRWFALFP